MKEGDWVIDRRGYHDPAKVLRVSPRYAYILRPGDRVEMRVSHQTDTLYVAGSEDDAREKWAAMRLASAERDRLHKVADAAMADQFRRILL